jgi:hypothetical protein
MKGSRHIKYSNNVIDRRSLGSTQQSRNIDGKDYASNT